jgi:cyclase
MMRKRLVAVVTVRDGIAVQSFRYGRYLPLGRPEVLVENLDRWGVDEIILQCIDRSPRKLGPDFPTLDRVSRRGLSTPLIYAGGISTVEQGVAAIQHGADRICIDAALHDCPKMAIELSSRLGAQALVAALPLAFEAGALRWRDYRTRADRQLSAAVLDLLDSRTVSEAMIIDWQHEGVAGGFDERLVAGFPLPEVNLIVFGGLSEAAQLRSVLGRPRVMAAAVGNFLSYREHAVQQLKSQLATLPVRPAAWDVRAAGST